MTKAKYAKLKYWLINLFLLLILGGFIAAIVVITTWPGFTGQAYYR